MNPPSGEAPDRPPKWRRIWESTHRLLRGYSRSNESLRRVGQFTTFHKAVKQVIEHTDQESVLLESLCSLAVQSTPVALAWICCPDDQGGYRTLAEAGETRYLEEFVERRREQPTDTGPLYKAWHDRTTVFNAPFPPGLLRTFWYKQAHPYGFRSLAVLPILRDRQPWALFVLYDREPQGFPSDCQGLLEDVVRRVGEALEDWINILRERVESEHQSLLGAALRVAKESVVLTNADRQVLYVNSSFTATTGYTLAEISALGMHVLQGPQTNGATLSEIDGALCSNGFFNGTLLNYRRDGSSFWNHLSIIPIHDKTGTLTHFVSIQKDVSAEYLTQEQLLYEACHDRLTNLGNRRALMDQVAVILPRVQRNKGSLAICMIDLDHFKPINDLYGHDAGDHVLRITSRRLQSALRRSDYVARLGGDEFVLLIEGFHSLEELEIILVKIEICINDPIHLKSGVVVGVRLSMGIYLYDHGEQDDFDTLLRYADQALYRSKAHKTTRERYWEFFDREHQDKTQQQSPLTTDRF